MENKITVTDDEGKIVECDVIMVMNNPNNNKNYIVYTDGTTNEEKQLELLASEYFPEGDLTRLEPIETDEEWEFIESMIEKVENEEAE